MTTLSERQVREIRKIRRGAVLLGMFFMSWWLLEFLTYTGAGGFDAVDFMLVVIVAAGVWLIFRASRSQCPQCGNPFFFNRALILRFHVSSECPYCRFNISEAPEPSK